MSFGDPGDDRRPNLTPTLALRVAVVGSVVLALFAIIFFRLWFLQVLTGSQYVEAAAHNTTRVVALAPPRGEILASNGTPLVTSTTELAAEIVPTELPVKVNQSNILRSYQRDDEVYDRLARVLHLSTKPRPCVVPTPPPNCNVSSGHCPASTTRRLSPIACTVAKSIALNTYADVTIQTPVSAAVQYYIAERANTYRGVEVTQTSVSGYPFTTLAAQTLGTVGRLSTGQQKERVFRHVNANAVVGQSGLEDEYDQFLRGDFGKQRVQVNSSGVEVSVGRSTQPKAGDDLRTTIDLPVQQVGQSALQHAIDDNQGLGGAFVAMDPQNGAIYGMGSLPSFNPTIFTHAVSDAEYRQLDNPVTAPLFNRATQSIAPDGSTFKPITSVAALESGTWTPSQTFDDTGEYCPAGSGIPPCFKNAGGAANGTIDMVTALKLSDDVFYYHLGALLNVDKPAGGALQRWAKRFGIGQNPHIDIPGARSGTLPTPTLLDAQVREEEQCETATGSFRYTNGTQTSATKLPGYHRSPKHPYDQATGNGGCGIAIPGQTWTVGDNINAAVGQGEDQVTPLQLAMVYSAIANNGTIVRPHLGDDIENRQGTVLQQLSFPAQRHLDINPTYLSTIQTGLNQAAQSPGGTSAAVMANFGKPVYGKTGTAQYIPTSGPRKGVESDYAWYAAYVPASATSRPIVVVAWVEGGGFGAVAAAPVVRQIMSQWFYGKPGPWTPGASSDR